MQLLKTGDTYIDRIIYVETTKGSSLIIYNSPRSRINRVRDSSDILLMAIPLPPR